MFYNLVHLRTQNQNRHLEFPESVLCWCGIQPCTAGCASLQRLVGGGGGGSLVGNVIMLEEMVKTLTPLFFSD